MYTRISSRPLPNSCLHHDHDYHQLVIALRGRAEFEINGCSGRVDPLHGCLIPGGDVHFYEGIGNNTHIIVDLPLAVVEGELLRLFDAAQYFEADTSMRLLLSYLHRETAMWEKSPEAAEGVAICLLTSLYQRSFDNRRTLLSRGKLDLPALEEYILRHLNEPLPVSRLARFAHVSAGHFHALFREEAGMTPGQYLWELRLKRAQQLLLETALPLVDVAEQAGFSSQSSFTHAFRRRFGVSPGRLRKPC
ncbi:AraC family transcriptional regulator [Pokkaliibacter plantistimulans]|uniref:AraC family transcriptional regulator n=1 Tax=Proteobacteria bacterium 228 TaxID=2083153 RepID=A0A2S5KK76_9PROT|nr:AraC family transcriptional regulator [Pokkaliibacter plantistimulans]PPC75247.1 AraC family transcriptional regulator [Pokkaliibacter plantistimulans]